MSLTEKGGANYFLPPIYSDTADVAATQGRTFDMENKDKNNIWLSSSLAAFDAMTSVVDQPTGSLKSHIVKVGL